MFNITKEQRDGLVNYLANSNLPAKDALQLIQMLNTLTATSKTESKKDEPVGQ